MNRKSIKKIISLFTLVVCTSQLPVIAQNGEATFKQTCSACHSIGKGRLVGPDLKDVHTKRKEDWIIKFVKGSQALIKSGDADAKAIFDEYNMVMPDQNLSDADIKAVIAYIGEQSGGAAASTEPAAEATTTEAPVEAASPELIANGKALFEGSKAFTNGGASCISCHNANYKDMIAGGVLAKDVTNAYSRLGGDAGLSGILSSPPFPAMTAAFKNNPLTEDEVKAITAFLKDADTQKAPEGSNPLLMGGIVGFVLIFIIIFILWGKRKNNNVKKDVYDRQIKAIN